MKGVTELKIELTEKLEAMLISAVRYALGRRTYIVQDTADYIESLVPYLSDWCLKSIQSDIVAQRKFGSSAYGDDIDYRSWMKLSARIEEAWKNRGGA